jgi:hypothetical protein
MIAEATERAAFRRRWEKATNWPLMLAAVIFLAAYALPVLDPDLPTWPAEHYGSIERPCQHP